MQRLCLSIVLVVLMFAAANPSVSAQSGDVEADAQKYTQLVMQHDRLVLKNNMRRISQPELAEMARLRTAFTAIKTKYGPAGALRGSATAYDKRVKELSASVVAPAVKNWVAEEFPEPDVVARTYADELQRSAAMQVLHGMLNEKVGKVPTQGVSAKLRRYEAAWMQVNSRSRDDYSTRLGSIEKFMWNKKFQFEVLDRFVPLYAAEAGSAASTIDFSNSAAAAKAQVLSAMSAVGLAVFALPLVYLTLGQRSFPRAMPRNADDAYPFQLPRALDTVKVFRKQFGVALVCGKVTNKTTWEETTKWTTTTKGQVRESGPWTFKDPDTTHTSSQTLRYYKYEVGTPEGGSRTETFLGHPSDLDGGQLFGMVVNGKHVLFYNNHSKSDGIRYSDGVNDVLAMPHGFLFWLPSMAIAVAGAMAVQRFLVTGALEGNTTYENVVGMTVVLGGPLVAIYIAVLRRQVYNLRERQFSGRWMPRFEEFMKGLTPPLVRHFGGDDRQRARTERRLEQQRSKD